MESGKRGGAVLKWTAVAVLAFLLAAYDPEAVVEFLPLAAAIVLGQVGFVLVRAGLRRRPHLRGPSPGRLRLSH
jgi:hypothetical protein